MSAFDWLYRQAEKRSGVANPAQWLVDFFTGGTTSTGLTVSPDSALKYSPVWAAVSIISGALGYLPLFIFKREKKGKSQATKHPQYELLHSRPNPHMSAQEFRETLTGHVLTWGNAYAEIERRGDERAVNYWPLRPDLTGPILDERGELWYEVRPGDGGESSFLPYRNVLHIKGLGGNGYQGYSVIEYHREAIGLGQAVEKYGSAFFGNNATPSGFLLHPGNPTEIARENLRREFTEKHRGLDNAHRFGILEEGLDWKQIGIPAKDSQLIETKKFSVLDVARIFQIPAHMLAEMSSATFSNIEHQGIEFVSMTLLRWLKKWEHEINYKLLPGDTHFSEFVVEGLLRGDSVARSNFYREMFNNGFLTLNEVRALENKNTIGPDGDKHFVNAALKPIEDIGKEPEPAPTPPPAPDTPPPDEPEADSFRPLILDLCGRVARRETKAAVKDYESHQVYVWQTFSAPMLAICRVFGAANDQYAQITNHVAESWREQSEKEKPTDWEQLRDDRCEMIMGVIKHAVTDTKS